jgi:hypothetical protein
MMKTKVKPGVSLTAQDRCDRCGAQAYAKVVKDNMELLFCGHHREDHEDALIVDGWEILHDHEAWERIASNNLTTADSD